MAQDVLILKIKGYLQSISGNQQFQEKMENLTNNPTSLYNPTTMDSNISSENLANNSMGLTGGIGIQPSLAEESINKIILPIICTCGIIGIILTIIVLSRKHMSTSTNCYLTGLAIADLLFLILFASTLHPAYPGYYIYAIYVGYATIFMNVFLMASIWLTVMLAIERYIAICRPFLATKLCTIRNAKIFITVIFVFAFICRLPNFWEIHVGTSFNTKNNKSVTYLEHTDFAFDEQYILIYPWIVDVILASIVPFLLLLILNVLLIWEVKKSTKYLRRTTTARSTHSAQREELQITVMLISVVIVFFLCQAPYVIYTAIVGIHKYGVIRGITLYRAITKMLLTLKSAVNFILYCWFSEKFRATLKRVFWINHCSRQDKIMHNGSYHNLHRSSNCTRDTCI